MKIAIVTGASSGMGRKAVKQIAESFHGIDEIWVVARRMDRLIALEEETEITLRKLNLDLRRKNAIEELRQLLNQEQPDVKWLVNGAGFGKIGPFESLEMEEITGMVDLNCKALCAVTHAILPFMSKNSRIIQFASAAAFLPQPDFAVYAATKSFVLSFSRALNAELKPRRIFVTAVCPGPVKTEFFDIAETTGKVAIYKLLVMADAKKVVKQALKDSAMGKPVSVYGISMKAFHMLCNIMPHGFILHLMGLLNSEKLSKK